MSTQYRSAKVEKPVQRFNIARGSYVQKMEWRDNQWIPATNKVRSIMACQPLLVGEFTIITRMKVDHFPIVRLTAFGESNQTYMVLAANAASRFSNHV